MCAEPPASVSDQVWRKRCKKNTQASFLIVLVVFELSGDLCRSRTMCLPVFPRHVSFFQTRTSIPLLTTCSCRHLARQHRFGGQGLRAERVSRMVLVEKAGGTRKEGRGWLGKASAYCRKTSRRQGFGRPSARTATVLAGHIAEPLAVTAASYLS